MQFEYLRNRLNEAKTIQIKSKQKKLVLGLIKNDSGIVDIFVNSVLTDRILEHEIFDNVASALYTLQDAQLTTDNDLEYRSELI